MGDDSLSSIFQQRRAVEQALDALAQAQSEAELVDAVRAIKFAHAPVLILPALLKRLETPSSQLRGGLARLAALLPPEECVPALRRYAADRRNPPQGRTTAAMILDRFLGEPPNPALTADLQQSNDAAFQSLAEAVADARTNPHVLLEYVTQMQPYGEEIALLVLQHLDRLPAADRVPLLQLMAHDERLVVARAALQRMDALAAGGLPPAARALYALQWAASPDIRSAAERAHRKLQFRGAGHQPPPVDRARALLAPAAISGAQWLLLLLPAETAPAQPDAAGLLGPLLLGLHGHMDHGVFDAFAGMPGEAMPLPPPAPAGTLHQVLTAAGSAEPHVEIPYDWARFLMLHAFAVQRHEPAQPAARGELLLHHDAIWRFAPPAPQPALAALLAPDLPPLPDDDAFALCTLLVQEPCMAGWEIPAQPLLNSYLDAGGGVAHAPLERLTREALAAIDAAPARTTIRRNLRSGLLLQAIWLLAAGRTALAEPTARLARTVDQWPLAENPLLFAALRRSLEQMRARRSR